VFDQELLDAFAFVCQQVVGNDVNLAAARLAGDELFAPVTSSGLADDLAGAGIEGGVQGEDAVSVVFETVAFSVSRGHGKNRIEPVEGLDVSLLINAEHGRMRGGLTYSPITSAALSSKSGSFDAM
jgi:hypothetical protein